MLNKPCFSPDLPVESWQTFATLRRALVATKVTKSFTHIYSAESDSDEQELPSWLVSDFSLSYIYLSPELNFWGLHRRLTSDSSRCNLLFNPSTEHIVCSSIIRMQDGVKMGRNTGRQTDRQGEKGEKNIRLRREQTRQR